jgi:acetyl-CoA C-acetyltransferase
MPLNTKVAVIGSAIRAPVTGNDKSLEELLYDVTQAALADAGITIEDVDGIVTGSNDQYDGRAISVMMASGSVGGVDRDILSTPSAGEHAFVMGVLRVATGQYRTQLVLSWSPTEAHSLAEVQRLGADPYFHRRLPLDNLAAHALQASALGAQVPDAHAVASVMAGNDAAGPDPKRWPLTGAMIAPPVVGLVAMVIASADFVTERKAGKVAWVRGMGWGTEAGFLGDRDLTTAPALAAAAFHAYGEAGITAPATAFDVAEIDDHTPYQALIALEGLGLSRREEWARDVASGKFAATGQLPVNPSGGVKAANAVFCTGLMRIAEAADQVRGTARRQVKGARNALAHAASGFAMQYQTVVVFGHDR